MATILLIEPHPLLRLGLRHLLAQARIPGDLIDIDPLAPIDSDLWLHQADLLVYGLPADQASGWQDLDELCQRLQPQRVLVLSDHVSAALADRAVPEPVRGCMLKSCCAEALAAAVRLVLAGGECFPSHIQTTRPALAAADRPAAANAANAASPDLARANDGARVLALRAGTASAAGPGLRPAAAQQPYLHPTDSETPSAGAHLLNITERQYEVLALLARGYPIKTVSRMLNISVATAKTHACTLYQRLHVRSKGEAVYVALQRGATLNWAGPQPVRPATQQAGVAA